jgi:hypothetical protein
MDNYIKVKSDSSLVRNKESNAIINNNENEFEKFIRLSETKYKEKMELRILKDEVQQIKTDINEIKFLLKSIVNG